MRMSRFQFELQFSTESLNDEAGIYRKIEESYRGWCSPVPAHQMIQARFYCTGEGDRVGCFYCGLGLCGWEEGDDPFELHKRWSPNCGFLEMSRPAPSQNDDEEAMDEVATSGPVVSLDPSRESREENVRLRKMSEHITNCINAAVVIQACKEHYSEELVSQADRIYRSQHGGHPASKTADLTEILEDLENASAAGGSLSTDDTSLSNSGASGFALAPASSNMRQEVQEEPSNSRSAGARNRNRSMWRSFHICREVNDVMGAMLTQLEENASVAGGSLPEDEGAAAASLPLNFKNGLKKKP